MRNRYRRHSATSVLILLLTIGLVMMGSAAAWAADVIRFTDDFDRNQGENDGDADCDGDAINDYSIDLDGRITLMLFDDGTVRVHLNWDGSAWVAEGDSVGIHHAFTVTEYPDGTFTFTGLGYGQFDDPGGPNVLSAGLFRSDGDGVFVAGPNELLEQYGLDPNAATCDVLGL